MPRLVDATARIRVGVRAALRRSDFEVSDNARTQLNGFASPVLFSALADNYHVLTKHGRFEQCAGSVDPLGEPFAERVCDSAEDDYGRDDDKGG
jgi:hypothetical protein